MATLKEFGWTLGGIGTGIVGYFIAKVMGFGNFRKKPWDTVAGLGLIAGSIVNQAYGEMVIKNRNAVLYISSTVGTVGLLKLFDTYAADIASMIAQERGFSASRSYVRSYSSPAPAQSTPKLEELSEQTPGLHF
jgi:hypothetical protein